MITRPHPCFLDIMEKYIVIGGRQVYRYLDKYYTWDEFHGEIEVFNKRGRHIMVLDANGNQIKDAVEGRRLNV